MGVSYLLPCQSSLSNRPNKANQALWNNTNRARKGVHINISIIVLIIKQPVAITLDICENSYPFTHASNLPGDTKLSLGEQIA